MTRLSDVMEESDISAVLSRAKRGLSEVSLIKVSLIRKKSK